MNKLLYIFTLAMLLVSCQKKDARVFDESPEERMGAKINELSTALVESEHGWKVNLTTTNSGGYGFYMDFDPASVTMVADLDDKTATEVHRSTFRIKWVMAATLVFDTYNYITMLQDPSPSAYGGLPGSGLQSDVEFEFLRSNGDTLVLRGFKYKNIMTMVKAKAEQKTRYLSSAFKSNIDAVNDFFTVKSNNYIEINGINNKVEFVLDKMTKIAKLQFINNEGSVIQVNGKYSFEDVGIVFGQGFSLQGNTFVSGKIENGDFVLYTASGTKYTIKQNDKPILPLPILFAYNGTYRELYIGTTLPEGITSGFNAMHKGAVDKFKAMNPSRVLLDVRFTLTNSTTATVTTRNNNGTTTFSAAATYKYVYENGKITLSNPAYDANWTARAAQLIDIQNFFLSGPFIVDYAISSNPNVTNIGGLYREADNSVFFYGKLTK
jgi:hypothetical protein